MFAASLPLQRESHCCTAQNTSLVCCIGRVISSRHKRRQQHSCQSAAKEGSSVQWERHRALCHSATRVQKERGPRRIRDTFRNNEATHSRTRAINGRQQKGGISRWSSIREGDCWKTVSSSVSLRPIDCATALTTSSPNGRVLLRPR